MKTTDKVPRTYYVLLKYPDYMAPHGEYYSASWRKSHDV